MSYGRMPFTNYKNSAFL